MIPTVVMEMMKKNGKKRKMKARKKKSSKMILSLSPHRLLYVEDAMVHMTMCTVPSKGPTGIPSLLCETTRMMLRASPQGIPKPDFDERSRR